MPHDFNSVRSRITKFIIARDQDIRLSLAVALSTIKVTIQLRSVPPQFKGKPPGGGVRDLPSLFLYQQPHESTCGDFDDYLEYPHTAKALHTSLGFEPMP
ncbi:hypothetical protein TNCV_3947491 [Trichonephila clavipes]|nr:hypothetical protein TNCV_3947491 [Trichonephila clavipes]